METLHIRADREAMRELMAAIDRCNRSGHEVELIDNAVAIHEERLITVALRQAAGGQTVSHAELWGELLDEKN